jgi:glutamate-1-semialdehyde 2,1-aminomutase
LAQTELETEAAIRNAESRRLLEKARRIIPGGVNSPVRAFNAVGGDPLFITRANGSRIHDADGNEYIDFVSSWGALIHGHAHPLIVEAIRDAATRGTSYGAPTPGEVELAEMICASMPSIEMVRFVNSGTEATMSAIRLARAFTGREAILKFDGCYHGHADSLLAKAGSGLATLGLPDSAGVPAAAVQNTIVAPYNDLQATKALFDRHRQGIAAIIVEPVAANMGVVSPAPGFLEGLRDLATANGSLLIFDEVITGFRLGIGGAQGLFGIRPDLTCLGKIIGGGLPVGAYGGRRDVMSLVAPLGPVYQAGTLSGNPIAMAAGIAALRLLRESNPYDALDRKASMLCDELRHAASRAGVPVTINRAGSLFTAFFTGTPVTDYASAKQADTKAYARFFRRMLHRGVSLAPSQFEAAFLMTAHSDADLEATVKAASGGLAS